MAPDDVPRVTSPETWSTSSDETVMPEAMIWAMSSTESKSIAPETTNMEPSPLCTPATDEYPPEEYPMRTEPSMPVTSAA